MKWPLFIAANFLAITLIFAYRSTIGRFFDRDYYKIMISIELVAVVIFGSCVIYETRSEIRDFFTYYKDVFTGIGYSSVTLGLVGLVFTFFQMRARKKQASASASYEIHKDGRNIFLSMSNEALAYIEEGGPQESEGERKIREIIMFYASVHHQWTFGNIDDEFFETTFLNEFCEFLGHPRVEAFWRNNIAIAPKIWGKEFIEMGQQCLS